MNSMRNTLQIMNDIGKYNITTEELDKALSVVDKVVDYYEEHIHSTVMDQMFDDGVITETDDRGMALINYAKSELLNKLNTNDPR